MTDPMMDMRSLVEKAPDTDLLREMIAFAAERLMELEVGASWPMPAAVVGAWSRPSSPRPSPRTMPRPQSNSGAVSPIS
jgi:hypothetical protein